MRQVKLITLVLSLFLCCSLFSPIQIHSKEPYSSHLLKEDFSPSYELQCLLKEMGLSTNLDYNQLLNLTQAQWIRVSKERWEEKDRFKDKKELILPLLKKLGCIDQVNASKKHYDYAIILGATVNGTRPKLIQLFDELSHGVKIDKIVVLTADWSHDLNRELPALLNLDQPLLPIKKDWQPPKEMPLTEYEITKALIDQIDLPYGLTSNDFDHITVKYLKDKDGNPRRANTKDTLIEFVKKYDVENKSCLVFSLQPYVGYQDAVVREILPKSCDIETIGREGPKDINVSVQLDNIARWIYALKQNNTQNLK